MNISCLPLKLPLRLNHFSYFSHFLHGLLQKIAQTNKVTVCIKFFLLPYNLFMSQLEDVHHGGVHHECVAWPV